MRLEDFDNDEDRIIQDRLKQKTGMKRTNDSCNFKIMAEFVNGYEAMGRWSVRILLVQHEQSQKILITYLQKK
jgi:hypothetical protein